MNKFLKYLVLSLTLLATACCGFAAAAEDLPASADTAVNQVVSADADMPPTPPVSGDAAVPPVPADAQPMENPGERPPMPPADGENPMSNDAAMINEAALTGPIIEDIEIVGNQEVVSEHITSIITSKIGEHLNDEKLRKDAEAIFELGFFKGTDYRVTDTEDGVKVTFMVEENPKVGEIKFSGNTVYSEEKLKEVIFTQPGMIFNRTFFRNDIQRIKEKYQSDGYVMASVKDVRIDGDVINVEIIEPKISEIIIQGNKITKKKIVERYLKIKVGELFNSNKLRLTLNRLQGVGYFSDVNVNFEPGENPEDVVIVFTVEEARTGKLGFNVSYGTQSGFGGGMSYENFNIGGKGLKLSVGFEIGTRRQYWLSFEQPYMSGHVMGWKIGAYKRDWRDMYYYENNKKYLKYDRDKYGVYFGFGKKFADESKFNWYVTLDWHKTENEVDSLQDGLTEDYPDENARKERVTEILEQELGQGTYASGTLSFRRVDLDEYLPYSKGNVESLNVQVGTADVENVTYSYQKYWLETRFYVPLGNFLRGLFETNFLDGVDNKPVLFALRAIGGTSTGDVPYDEMYKLGGDTTLRGYSDDYYHGGNMVLMNAELRIPIQKMFSLVFFYDLGRAWEMGNYKSNKGNEDWGKAPGIGVRLNTPLGNLRLDYAQGDDESRFHFGFGELF